LKKLTLFFDKITSALTWIATAVFCVVLLCIILNVIGRATHVFSINGIIEIVQYGMLVVMSIALARTGFKGQHVRVSMFSDMMSEKPRAVTVMLEMLISAAVFGAAVYVCITLVVSAAAAGRITDTHRIPLYLIYAFLTFGLFVSAVTFIYNGIVALTPFCHESQETLNKNTDDADKK
jgi:TRAP-type C4-dicarboxylate transport system permease small subunit